MNNETPELPARGPQIERNAGVYRMPFPAGVVALLLQGNHGRSDMSHSDINCLHAIDFTGLDDRIVASADGEVIQVFNTAALGDYKGGYGFGNFVKLRHFWGEFSFYSHLASVTVTTGDHVRAGELIGTMGNTGWAGSKHLHFSVHPEPNFEFGVGPTCVIERFVCSELERPTSFIEVSSESLKDFRADENGRGILYGSENSSENPAFIGTATGALAEKLTSNRLLLENFLAGQPIGKWPFSDPV